MLKCKKITALLTALCMVFMLLPGVSADEEAVKVVLSDSGITVDGETISQDAASAVYLAERTETHEDISDEFAGIVNKVITISKAGGYEFWVRLRMRRLRFVREKTTM